MPVCRNRSVSCVSFCCHVISQSGCIFSPLLRQRLTSLSKRLVVSMLYMAATKFAEFLFSQYAPEHVVHGVMVSYSAVLHIFHCLVIADGLGDVVLLFFAGRCNCTDSTPTIILQACFTFETRLSSGICNTNVAIILCCFVITAANIRRN